MSEDATEPRRQHGTTYERNPNADLAQTGADDGARDHARPDAKQGLPQAGWLRRLPTEPGSPLRQSYPRGAFQGKPWP